MKEIRRTRMNGDLFAIFWILGLLLLCAAALLILFHHLGFALKLLSVVFGIFLLLAPFYIFEARFRKKDE